MPLQLRSLVREDAKLELSLAEVDMPEPNPNEVIVEVQASPINPSDLGLLFGMADMSTAKASGTAERPVITADIPERMMRASKPRVGHSMPVGNEGAGVVVAAGSDPDAQALMGKTVAILGGAMYAQYRAFRAKNCLVMPEGTSAADGASCFVNPLTAIGMTETMRREGHKALIHTAAASNLGQMLQKLCIADGIDLVNIVRKPEQEQLLRGIGAKYVCNSSSDTFMEDLIAALTATGATIAFDATGGGNLASQILTAMEASLNANADPGNRYGSSQHKQVYIYGGLDRSPTTLNRAYGMAWGLGGWLLTPFLQEIGPEAAQALRERVAREVKTIFASTDTKGVSLAEVLTIEAVAEYGAQATGLKYLINPSK